MGDGRRAGEIEESMRTTVAERLASVLLALEGVALLVLGGWEIAALLSGDAASLASSVALTVLTTIGAAAVLAFAARPCGAGRRGDARGGIVTQLLVARRRLRCAHRPLRASAAGLPLAVPAT